MPESTKRERRARKVESMKRQADWCLTQHKRRAVERVGQMLADSVTTWDKRTVADMTALKLAEWHEAENRARNSGPQVTNNFGIVYLPQLADDAEAWEKKVAQRRQAAIEAEVAAKLPPDDPEAA